jgi:hypothetical protein
VFRTLELVSPAVWLRRLNARLSLELPLPAPSILKVRLWQCLPLPAVARLAGSHSTIDADVVIETEHAVWGLLARHGGDVVRGAEDLHGVDPIAALAHATAELAGTRRAYVGLVMSAPEECPLGIALIGRYRTSATALRLRLDGVTPSAPTNVGGFGAIRWNDLKTILEECAAGAAVPALQRDLAGRTASWLGQVL